MGMLAGLVEALSSNHSDGAAMLIGSVIMLAVGIAWFKSQKPTHHVMLATAAGERQGLSSQDGSPGNCRWRRNARWKNASVPAQYRFRCTSVHPCNLDGRSRPHRS
jgi:hypothetical protein